MVYQLELRAPAERVRFRGRRLGDMSIEQEETARKECVMAHLKVGVENGTDIEIYYEDHGSGRPVILIHGYPLNGRSWERQQRELLAAGDRALKPNRGARRPSTQPTSGYEHENYCASQDAPH